jgi:hypothetical protein
MLKTEEIKRIELSPRQLFLFDLEERTVLCQEQILANLSAWVPVKGEAEVSAFVQSTADALGLSGFTVLQHLFWLAQELKIQFTSAGRAISPNEARTRLLRSAQTPVQVVLNQSVEAAVFTRVKGLLNQMGADADGEAPRDEVELAHLLARTLRAWKRQLDVCRLQARRPGFPGREKIDGALAFIRTLAAKLDAISLIHAFHEHADALARLQADVTTLTTFYDEHAERWRRLLQFAQKATETLDSLAEKENISAAYERFKQIMADPQPYHRVDEAHHLLQTLEPCHDRIVAQRTEQGRAEARLKIEALIQKMKTHLDRQAADDDARNRPLYALRQHLKAIETAPTLTRIHRQMRLADEDYELFIDGIN